MDLFLFSNFFPYKKAEPFLVNEFEFTRQNFKSISVLSLYGKPEDLYFKPVDGVHFFKPILGSPSEKKQLFLKGFFNLSPLLFHMRDFFQQNIFLSPKKMHWFSISFLMTRLVLSSASYKELLGAIVRAQDPTLYFYWGDNLAWIIPYLKKDLKGRHVKIIMRLHRTDLYEYLKAGYAPLRQEIFALTDVIVPISQDGNIYLTEKYPDLKRKIFLSRLGVFDHGLNPVNTGDVKHVISVSGLVEVKRVHLIFETLQKAKQKIVWHHFGDGPLSESLKEMIKQKRNGLEIILHGFVDNKTLLDFYKKQSIDLLLNVSASEGLPVSIMEALSFGVPVIATNAGGTSDLVDEKVGKLIDIDFDPGILAASIDEILSASSEKKRVLRKNARSAFEKKVNAEHNYPAFYRFILGA